MPISAVSRRKLEQYMDNEQSKKPSQTTRSELLRESMRISRNAAELDAKTGKALIKYTWFWSLSLLLAVPFACLISGEGSLLLDNLFWIWTSPSKLITDYFNMGSIGSAFLNAALCGLACNVMMLLSRAKPCATLLSGYFLVIAHCFYGLNFINMWPPFLGVFVFSLIFRIPFGNILHIAMFATSLGPFISDLLFRYTLGDGFVFGEPRVTLAGAILALVFGLLSGLVIPALLPGTARSNRGYNLFKAGLAIGLFGMASYALLYKTFGMTTPDVLIRDNPLYSGTGTEYILFADIFFVLVFLLTLLAGFCMNQYSFKGYRRLFRCDGWHDDFPQKYGMPLTLINIGIYGFCVLAYLNLAFLFTDGVGFSGPTVGVTIAAITFSASGQTPRNVWPIALGYILLSTGTECMGALTGLPIVWSISSQSYINGMAFATGLCPFVGRYGVWVGIIAGALHGILCTSTAAMHGGFVLYNGGLTSGLTAILLLSVLEFFRVKTKVITDE